VEFCAIDADEGPISVVVDGDEGVFFGITFEEITK
jgi:hypothetical protein